MSQPFEHERSMVTRITEGMDVIDRDGHKIGTVEQIHFGAAEDHGAGAATTQGAAMVDNDPISELVTRIFGADRLPEEVRERLLRLGFIRVDADGLFAADRYVTLDQVTSVADDKVMLRATRDELVKR